MPAQFTLKCVTSQPYFRKKAEGFRIPFNLTLTRIYKDAGEDLQTITDKNHTGDMPI